MISVKWSLPDPCTHISTHRSHKYTHVSTAAELQPTDTTIYTTHTRRHTHEHALIPHAHPQTQSTTRTIEHDSGSCETLNNPFKFLDLGGVFG